MKNRLPFLCHHLVIISKITSSNQHHFRNFVAYFHLVVKISFDTDSSLSVCQGCCNKVLQIWWIKQQTFVFSQSWKLEVWARCSQGWFLLRAVRKNLFHASPPASGWQFGDFSGVPRWYLPSSPHSIVPVCVCPYYLFM